MYPHRNPITDENFDAYNAATSSLHAAGISLSHQPAAPTYSGATVRDVAGEMADCIVETGSGTRDDLLLRFDDREIDTYLPEARRRANRAARRQVA